MRPVGIPGLALAALFVSTAAWPQKQASIGYPSVSAALEALAGDSSVTIREKDGWTVAEAEEGDAMILWTFTSPIHSAHPTAVKRIMRKKEGVWQLEMKVLCEADNDSCNELVAVFQELNTRMRENLKD